MKRILSVGLVAMVGLALVLPSNTEAGLFDKWNKKDKPEKRIARYDLLPTMTFYKGVLGYGVGNNWELDGLDLHLVKDCKITSEMNDDESLKAGSEVLVMGSRIGDAIVAHRIRMVKPDYMNEGKPKSSTVIPSEVDPTVGEGTGPE